jgi:hypothetical protein
MREWKFWDWTAYASLFFGALGIVAHALNGEGAGVTSSWPTFFQSGYWAYVPLALVIYATIVLLVRGFRAPKAAPAETFVDSASITLRIHDDARGPERISASNIWRWSMLHTSAFELDETTRQLRPKRLGDILFLTFDPFVRVGTLLVQSPDMQLPRYEIKEFHSRFAIVAFDVIPAGTLVISVVNN